MDLNVDKKDLILAIAADLVQRVKDDKRPFSSLKWIVDYCPDQYRATKSEVMEAYFAAINILKQNGIENAKRKPLTTLTKQQRAIMRKQAKELAALLQRFIQIPTTVSRCPISTDNNGQPRIQIEIKRMSYSTSFLYPTFEELERLAAMDEPNKMAYVYKFAQSLKNTDDRISENIETLKANLEARL